MTLAARASPTLQSGGQTQKWPTRGPDGYITLATSWDAQRFRAGDRIRSGPQVGKVGEIGYITLAASGGNQRFIAGDKISSGPKVSQVATKHLPSGVPTSSERGPKSAVAHKWAEWLHNPYRLGGPQRFKAGNRVTKGPQVDQVAT